MDWKVHNSDSKEMFSDIFFVLKQQKQKSKIALFDTFPLFDISFLVCSSISVAYREPLGRPLGRLWVTMLTLILHNRSCLLLMQSFWLKSLICADVADNICFSRTYKFWDWELISGCVVKAISLSGLRSPCLKQQ